MVFSETNNVMLDLLLIPYAHRHATGYKVRRWAGGF